MSVRLLSVVVMTGCAIAAVTACSTPPSSLDEGDIKKATQASSVTIQMLDKAGSALGSCSGTLVSKNLVLTAGHCAAGVASWKVANGSATATAKRAVTPWKAFGSNLAHPDHADLALIVLSSPITLDRYPTIAASPLSPGARALHFARSSAAAAAPTPASIDLRSGKASGFRLDYTAKMAAGSYLDTGGAIVDPSSGKIVGVASARGMTSGLLYMARTDNFAKWIADAITCGEAASGTVSPRGYPGSSSSSGGDWGGYGGGGGSKLDAAPPPPYGGDGGGSSGSSGSSGTSGSSGSSGSNDGGTAGSTPGDGTDNPGGEGGSTCPGTPSCEGGDCPGKNGPGTPGSMTPGGGGDGNGDGDDTPGSNGGNNPGSETPPGTDVCPGPPGCPEPDSQRCSDAYCGGCGGVLGCGDATMDYGDCASCGSDTANGKPPVLR